VIRRIRYSFLVVSLLISVATLPCACTPEERDLAWEIFMEWSDGRSGSALAGSTGDPEADAALDAGHAIRDIKKADDHMQNAVENEDVHEAGKAIELRPNDWTYRLRTATLMLQVSHVEWEGQFNAADRLVAKTPDQTPQYADQAIQQLEQVRAEFAYKDFTTYQCESLFERLSFYYKLRWDCCGGSKYDWDQYQRYKEDATRCRQ
jgi:hypothetical protein